MIECFYTGRLASLSIVQFVTLCQMNCVLPSNGENCVYNGCIWKNWWTNSRTDGNGNNQQWKWWEIMTKLVFHRVGMESSSRRRRSKRKMDPLTTINSIIWPIYKLPKNLISIHTQLQWIEFKFEEIKNRQTKSKRKMKNRNNTSHIIQSNGRHILHMADAWPLLLS